MSLVKDTILDKIGKTHRDYVFVAIPFDNLLKISRSQEKIAKFSTYICFGFGYFIL